MKKLYSAILIGLCLVVFSLMMPTQSHAAVTARDTIKAADVFAKAPLEVLDILRPSARLDMIDYFTQADSIVEVNNALEGKSHIVQLTPDYLKVALTPVSSLEIKILQAGKSQVVMTLYTTGSEDMAKDTKVTFFDAELNPLRVDKLLKTPSVEDFFNLRQSGISKAQLLEKVPFEAVVYSSGPGEVPLTATLTTLSVLSDEDRKLLQPLIIPLLTADWKGSFKF